METSHSLDGHLWPHEWDQLVVQMNPIWFQECQQPFVCLEGPTRPHE